MNLAGYLLAFKISFNVIGQVKNHEDTIKFEIERFQFKTDSLEISRLLALNPEMDYRFHKTITLTQKQIQLFVQRLALMNCQEVMDIQE